MNDNKNVDKKLSLSKKVRYGSSAIVFTTVFVVFILLLNVVISVIDDKTGGLYIDMTNQQIYTVGEQSKKALENVTQPIEIIFASPKDIVEGADSLNSVKMLCESYASLYENITVSYRDVLSEVAYFNQFKTTSADEITSTSLVIYCPSTGLSKIFSLADNPSYIMSDMYKYSSETYRHFAFDGENKLTNAFLTVTANSSSTLKAGFISGHNEQINDVLKVFLEDNGFTVDTVELRKTSSTELSQYDLLIVCEPRNDFSGRSGGAVNEIELLRDYVIESFGNIMFFTGYSGTELDELYSLIEENFGVKVNNASGVIESSENAIAGTGGTGFFGSYSTDTTTNGYKIHKSFSQGQTRSDPRFENCSSLEIVFKNDPYFDVSPIIVTSGKAVSFDGKTAKSHAVQPLMTLSRYTKLIDGVERKADVIVCSSSSFLNYLNIPAYSNSDILRSAISQMSDGISAASIDFKLIDEYAITVTKETSDNMTRRLAVICPVIIAVIGIVVFIKRKYL